MITNESNVVNETTETTEVVTSENTATETIVTVIVPAEVLSITRKYIRKAVEENLKDHLTVSIKKRDLEDPDVKVLIDTLIEDLFKTAVEEAYSITETNGGYYEMLADFIDERKKLIASEKEKAIAEAKASKVAEKAAKKAEKEANKPKKVKKTKENTENVAETTPETEVKA